MWRALSLPPAVMVLMVLISAVLPENDPRIVVLLAAAPITLVAIVIGIVMLARVLQTRFRGSAIACMVVAYLLGELLICTAIWFGACLQTIRF
jgi:hypothetical protein